MKYGIAIVWDGPTASEETNRIYAHTVLTALSTSILQLNQQYIAGKVPTVDATLIPGTAQQLNPPEK